MCHIFQTGMKRFPRLALKKLKVSVHELQIEISIFIFGPDKVETFKAHHALARPSQSTRATPMSSELLNIRSGGGRCRATHSSSAFVSASNKIGTAGRSHTG